MFELWVFIIFLLVFLAGALYQIDKIQKWQNETDEWADMVNDYIVKTQGKDCIGFKEE